MIVVTVTGGASDRRVVLTAVDDDEAERVAAAGRARGEIVVVRPEGGPQLDAWIEHTRPVLFGDRLEVLFAWSEHPRGNAPLVVELGLRGFGNGSHPTTRMLVDELVARIRGGERVLDVGCGSGVLGLCAARLGASRVVAMDIKPEAVSATRRNAALNGLDDRVAATGAPVVALDGPFDVVVANLGRAAIVELAPDLRRLLAPGGWLAVSGIAPSQCDLVAGFLRPLAVAEARVSGDWAALVLSALQCHA